MPDVPVDRARPGRAVARLVGAGAGLVLFALVWDWRAVVVVGVLATALEFAPRPGPAVKRGVLLAVLFGWFAAPPLWGRRAFYADAVKWAVHGFSTKYLEDELAAPKGPEYWKILYRMREDLKPGDRIMVFGNYPAFYFQTGARPASRYYWTRHVFVQRPGVTPPDAVVRYQAQARERFVREFLASAPRFVVLVDPKYESVAPNEQLQELPPIKHELREHYRLVTVVQPFALYERVADAG